MNNLQSAEQFLKKQAAKKESPDNTKKIKKAISILNNMGLKLEDLGTGKNGSGAKRGNTQKSRKVPAKYRITVKGATTE